MREMVFLVMQTKRFPNREIVAAVCATQERADAYVRSESRPGEFRIVPELLLT